MRTILDFKPLGRRYRFQAPGYIIRATKADEVPAALKHIDDALAEGFHVAGWLSYELGYALEARLVRLMGRPLAMPLIKLGVYGREAVGIAQTADVCQTGPLIPEWSFEEYRAAFEAIHRYICAGDIYQANLSFRSRFRFTGDAFGLYERLRTTAAADYCAFIDNGEHQIASLSPELFFSITPDRRIQAKPMKGTAPRDADDESARRRLADSLKDRSENLMIVDLIRNDLSRIAEDGSMRVRDLFSVETYPTLHAMTSTVNAQLRSSVKASDVLKALFPCGSITGAPKIRAMEILRALEISPRGPYCGAIGMFNPDGSAIFNVGIRTILLQDGQGELGIGGGVVFDSTAEQEYAECLLKAQFLVRNMQPVATND